MRNNKKFNKSSLARLSIDRKLGIVLERNSFRENLDQSNENLSIENTDKPLSSFLKRKKRKFEIKEENLPPVEKPKKCPQILTNLSNDKEQLTVELSFKYGNKPRSPQNTPIGKSVTPSKVVSVESYIPATPPHTPNVDRSVKKKPKKSLQRKLLRQKEKRQSKNLKKSKKFIPRNLQNEKFKRKCSKNKINYRLTDLLLGGFKRLKKEIPNEEVLRSWKKEETVSLNGKEGYISSCNLVSSNKLEKWESESIESKLDQEELSCGKVYFNTEMTNTFRDSDLQVFESFSNNLNYHTHQNHRPCKQNDQSPNEEKKSIKSVKSKVRNSSYSKDLSLVKFENLSKKIKPQILKRSKFNLDELTIKKSKEDRLTRKNFSRSRSNKNSIRSRTKDLSKSLQVKNNKINFGFNPKYLGSFVNL